MCFLEKKIEYQESLLELVVKKICRNVFSKKYVMLSISLPEAAPREMLQLSLKIGNVESLIEVNLARKT